MGSVVQRERKGVEGWKGNRDGGGEEEKKGREGGRGREGDIQPEPSRPISDLDPMMLRYPL